jgi:ABC-type multidrug transport system permease subunit
MSERQVRGPLFELTLARCREMFREPEAVFWVFVFPVLMSAVLALAFRSRPPEALPVAVVAGEHAEARVQALAASEQLEVIRVDSSEAREALVRGRVVLSVTDEEPPRYLFDPTQPESRVARLLVEDALQRAAGRGDVFEARDDHVEEPGSRYVDFLVPGLLGMNLMGTGMFGVGFGLVAARNGNLLKRFVASPVRRSQLLGAQLLSRLTLLGPEVALLLGFASLVLGVPQRGDWLLLAGIALLGALAFAGIGLLTASRARTIEGVSGIMNLVMVPMWIGSGVFFSTERFPAVAQPFVQALPLTALNDALRSVMLRGAGAAAVAGELAILAVWGAVAFVVALRIFRWQ